MASDYYLAVDTLLARAGSIEPLRCSHHYFQSTWKAAMEYDYERFTAELGARVRRLRTDRGLTHRLMITEHGFHLNQLHRIEGGEGVSVQTLLKLCAAFDVTIVELLDGLDKEKIRGSGKKKPL